MEGDDAQFYAVAMQLAAAEARRGHTRLARDIRDLVDIGKREAGFRIRSHIAEAPEPVALGRPRGDLASLLWLQYSELKMDAIILPREAEAKLQRVIFEFAQRDRLRAHGLSPRRKILLIGPPGSGKTMTASVLAGELQLPLFTILLEGVITKYMGETSAKLRLVFDSIRDTRGVYLFDEFDAIGGKRTAAGDVGEIRRVLNSFLQFLEQDKSDSLILSATNHPELLDKALFRRFDDIIRYELPSRDLLLRLLKRRLTPFNVRGVDWQKVTSAAQGLSQADIIKAADESAKDTILSGRKQILTESIVRAVRDRKADRY